MTLKVHSWELSDAPPAGELMVVRCDYDLEVAGERQCLTCELFVSTAGARELGLGFATVDGVESRVRYSVQREPLASARARVPALRDLPDAGVWKFLATPAPVIAQR